MELQEGQTLAVAGLLQNRSAGNSARTPFLADIPIVNRLTGIDRVQSSEQELVILVTPRLVGERVGLHPVAVIFALLAFGQLFGFIGVLIALPASAVVLVALRRARRAYLASPLYQG